MPEKRKNLASPHVEPRSGLEISPKAAKSGLPDAGLINHPCRYRWRTERSSVRLPHATGKPSKILAIWEPRLHPRHFLAISARLRRRGRDEPGPRYETRRNAGLLAPRIPRLLARHSGAGCRRQSRDAEPDASSDDRAGSAASYDHGSRSPAMRQLPILALGVSLPADCADDCPIRISRWHARIPGIVIRVL